MKLNKGNKKKMQINFINGKRGAKTNYISHESSLVPHIKMPKVQPIVELFSCTFASLTTPKEYHQEQITT